MATFNDGEIDQYRQALYELNKSKTQTQKSRQDERADQSEKSASDSPQSSTKNRSSADNWW